MTEGNDGDESNRKLINLPVHKVGPLLIIKGMVAFAKLYELLNCESGGGVLVCLIIGNQEGLKMGRTFGFGCHSFYIALLFYCGKK